jgi:hypothetical protein
MQTPFADREARIVAETGLEPRYSQTIRFSQTSSGHKERVRSSTRSAFWKGFGKDLETSRV